MTNLHVLAGKFKNRVLKSPPEKTTRPTTAVVRKAVFDMVAPSISEATFLDICAGSGAMGIEALSRGASHSTFIEKDKAPLFTLRANLQLLKLETHSTVLALDALKALNFLEKKKSSFDLIYCDPPYLQTTLQLELLLFLDKSSLLRSETILFLEEEASSPLDVAGVTFSKLQLKDSRRFGNTLLHRYIVRM